MAIVVPVKNMLMLCVCVCVTVRRPGELQASAGRHGGAPWRHTAGQRRLPVRSVQQPRQHPGERQHHGHEWVSHWLTLLVQSSVAEVLIGF